MSGWAASLKLAWRELVAEGRRSLFFALLVAVGVASLVGVQGVARSVEAGTQNSARMLLQGDLKINQMGKLTDAQTKALDDLKAKGADVSPLVSSTDVALDLAGETNVMVTVKAVDPKTWPYYGGFTASPDKPLAQLITGPNQAVVSPSLLERLSIKVGDSFKLGKDSYTVVGTVVKEPQAMDGSLSVGPRVITSISAMQGNALLDLSTSYLIKLPSSLKADDVKAQLASVFKGDQTVQTDQDAWRQMATVMGYVFTFLSLVAFISLLIGGLGVAMAMRTFISQKFEQIAILKSLGASSRRIMGVFLAEALMLGAAGSLIGAVLGLALQMLMPLILRDLLPTVNTGLNYSALVGGVVAGIGTAVVCALIPVRAVRNIKAGTLFRSESVPVKRSLGTVLETILVVLLVLAGLGWMASYYAHSYKIGFGFLGGILAVAWVLFLVTLVLLVVVRLLPQSGFPAIRHALRSLHAPGNQATAVVVSLGMGVALLMTIYLLQNAVVDQVRKAGTGPNTPNVILANVPPDQRSAIRAFLEKHEGVAKVQDPISMATGQVVTVDGGTNFTPPNMGQPYPIVALGREVPTGKKVVQGDWFTADDTGKPLLSLERSMAEQLQAHVGSKIVLRFGEKEIEYTVKVIIDNSGAGVTAGVNAPIATAPGSLDEFVQMYILMATTKPHQETAVLRDITKAFPGTVPIGLGELLDVVDDYLGRIANVIRFMTAFAVIASGVILSGSLSATRFRRRKESALLKTLGATRATVATSSALENGILGAVAGLAGAGLGYGLMKGIGYGLKLSLPIGIWPLLTATVAGALLAMIIGTASTLDVLRVRPLTVLRGE